MRFFTPLFCLLFATTAVVAQDVKFQALDKSPLDAAHYPYRSRYLNYLDEEDPDRTRKIKVLYSRPAKQGRELFGSLVPFGQDWRLGANEATEVTFYQNVGIGQVVVPAGIYTMFAEPVDADTWIIKVSTERFIGGSENRDTSKDILATEIDVVEVPEERERFSIAFQEIDDHTVHMLMEWGNSRAALPINLSPPRFDADDASPMDLVQFPAGSRLRNYLEPEEMDANEPQVRVVYGRPSRNGRELFGALVPYGELWRFGANETTEITFFNDVTIDGTTVEAGQYGLFAEVEEGAWTFVLHKATQSWGEPNFDEEDTVLKYKADVEKTPETLEAFSIALVDAGDNTVHLAAGWGDVMARMPIVLTAE